MHITSRHEARRLFAAGVAAADPEVAMRRALSRDGLPQAGSGRYVLIAIGKAARGMMGETLRHLPVDATHSALVVTNYENDAPLDGAEVMAAAHPVPDENGLRAGKAVTRLAEGAHPGDVVVVLISGGGSALVPAPADGISLADKAEVNRLLLSSGLEIGQMNLVRQQLSQLKGGGLARLAARAHLRTYVLSDVIGDDLSAIASGPTMPPLGDRAMARKVLKAAGIWAHLPDSVRAHLERDSEAPEPIATPDVVMVGSNGQSLDAVVAAAEGPCRIVTRALVGDVEDAVTTIFDAIHTSRGAETLVFGGETTVRLRGAGRGGRNQELALRLAARMAERPAGIPEGWAFLSGGTDGRDGPTDAAGGLVDAGTVARIATAGGDLPSLLADNDSFRALGLSGDLLITGATGTNVADIQIFVPASFASATDPTR